MSYKTFHSYACHIIRMYALVNHKQKISLYIVCLHYKCYSSIFILVKLHDKHESINFICK